MICSIVFKMISRRFGEMNNYSSTECFSINLVAVWSKVSHQTSKQTSSYLGGSSPPPPPCLMHLIRSSGTWILYRTGVGGITGVGAGGAGGGGGGRLEECPPEDEACESLFELCPEPPLPMDEAEATAADAAAAARICCACENIAVREVDGYKPGCTV